MADVQPILSWIVDTLRVSLDFSGHLLLLVELGAIIAIIFLGLGRGFGLGRLFWHEQRLEQGVAGLGATLLASELFFVSYLLVQRPDFGGTPDAVVGAMSSGEYLLHGAAALAVALVVPVALFLRGKGGLRPTRRWPMALGGLVGVLVTASLVTLADGMAAGVSPRICEALPGNVTAALELGARCRDVVHHHVLATSFFLLLFAVYVSAGLFRGLAVPPAAGICILLALVAAGLGSFSFWLGGMHVLVVVGVAACLVWLSGRDAYKRRIAALADRYAPEALSDLALYEASSGEKAELVRPDAVPWRDVLPEVRGKRPLVLVCASGGGLRAAVWTTSVLCALEEELPAFPYHVRLVSGASGGMVGAGAWVGTLAPPKKGATRPGAELHVIPRAALVEAIGRDCLSKVTQSLVFRDIPSRFLPLRYTHDRGTALEEAFLDNIPDAYRKNFGDLAPGEAAGWLPSLVYSPMLAEDGRRLLVSNLDLDCLLVQEGPRVGTSTGVAFSRSGYELGRLFPGALAQFPLRSAARLSASFPFLSPAAVLPTTPRRRVLDAGYWDNYGVSVACAFLEACVAEDVRAGALGRWLRENVSGVLLVQIRDGIESRSADGADYRIEKRRPPSAMARGLEGLSSPIEGALSARAAAMLFRNDEQIEVVARRFEDAFGPGFFSTATFTFRGHVSLSWSLTGMEKRKLVRAASRVVSEQADALRAWWKARAAVDSERKTEVA